METGAAQVDAGYTVGLITAEESQPKETSAHQRHLGAHLSACAPEGTIILFSPLDSKEICPLPWRGTLTQYSKSVSTQHPWKETKAVGVFAEKRERATWTCLPAVPTTGTGIIMTDVCCSVLTLLTPYLPPP